MGGKYEGLKRGFKMKIIAIAVTIGLSVMVVIGIDLWRYRKAHDIMDVWVYTGFTIGTAILTFTTWVLIP